MDWYETLKQQQILDDASIERLKIAVEGGESPLSALQKMGVGVDLLRNTMAAFYGIESYTYNNDDIINEKILRYVPEESARYYRSVPVKSEDGILYIATSDPDDMQMRQAMQFISTKHNQPHAFLYTTSEDIEKLLKKYESLTGEVDEALSSLESQLEAEIAEKQKGNKGQSAEKDIQHLKEDAPVTKIVATTLRYAVDGKASDIHIEPTGHSVEVRFRVDGDLQKILELPQKVHSALIARVKILSSMRLDEKRKPQDGRFSANFDGRKIDFRVSVLPTNHGEKVVMRILDTAKGVRTLEDTGIEPHHLDIIRRIVKEPYGIILISGPTGSGKSTTLYAMLSEVDRLTKNVLSLEDPVEYDIEHVSQSQVRPEIGYTFADGLRSALRQDPDIIMVGEIRDKETAQLAIQAALTGHLVLSTIHTNNSIGVVPRLIDMGVDPYLIAPTLKLAIAQRLARRLCPTAGEEIKVEGAIKQMIDAQFETLPEKYHDRIPKNGTMLHPEPSPGCASGTKGRVAVMETFEVNEQIQDLILKGGSEEQMHEVARKHGFMSMKEDAVIKALRHVIPYEEISMFGIEEGDDVYFEEENVDKQTEEKTESTPGTAIAEDELSEKQEIVQPQDKTKPDEQRVDNSISLDDDAL